MANIANVRRFLRSGVARVFPGVTRALEQQKEVAEQEGDIFKAMALQGQLEEQTEKLPEALEKIAQAYAEIFSDEEINELTRIFSIPVMQKFYNPDTVTRMMQLVSGTPKEESSKLN